MDINARKKKKRSANWLLSLALISLLLCYVVFYPGLPRDEEMIEHFYRHRADIEELIRRYRNFVPIDNGSHHAWAQQVGTPEIMERAQVSFINFSGKALWLQDPYSQSSGKKIYAMIGMAGDRNPYSFQRYGELQIELSPRRRYSSNNLYHGVIWKWIVFFPESPKIEDEKLVFPTDWNGKTIFKERVESSLNILPTAWKEYGCAYRKIEGQWFLKICNGH